MTIIPFSQRQKMRLYEQLEFSLSILLTLVFFMALFARFLSKSILRPVSAITRAAARMAKGLSNRPIQIHRQDELERMVAAFNTMQDRVVGSQTALRQQLYLLDATLGSMSSGVLGFSQTGQVLLDNAITWKLLQLNQACGQLNELIQKEALAALGPAFEAGRNTEMNLVLNREGEVRQILVKLRFVKVTRDVDVYCIMAFEDITAALAASRFKAWAEMARRIAHEIKNPLTPIQLEMDHLNRIYKDQSPHFGEALMDASNEIRLQVDHLKRIATEFSDYARPLELQHETTDLSQLIHSLVDPYARTLTRLTLELDLATAVIVEVDPRLIRRAFHNLILNAIQAMNEEGTLHIWLASAGDHVTCWIEDTGPGIPLDERDRVFEAYFSTKDHGSGLGLVIARKYILSHGGTLTIDGKYTHGTRFVITLPLTAQTTNTHHEF